MRHETKTGSPAPPAARLLAAVWLLLFVLAATADADAPGAEFPAGSLTFVESVPVETGLDLPELPDAAAVWFDLVEGAERTLDVFSFYFSPNPDGVCRLQPVLAAIEDRAQGGVAVRLLGDRKFHANYPETLERLGGVPGISARLLDAEFLWGGVLHSKGMIIDGDRFFLGSQNWDWRALEHIHELGAVVAHAGLATCLARIYELDWALAGGELPTAVRRDVPAGPEWRPVHHLALPDGRLCEAVLAASPPQALPPGVPWDLPLLVEQLDRAESRVRLQLLSYNPVGRDGGWWGELDNALRRAAARGCTVQILLSNWAKREHMLPHIQSLAVLPGITVRFVNIPEWSGGFIPFARTEHAKFATCDGRALWLGTSNGARDYFHQSRNVSLLLRGDGCADAADAFFAQSWRSPYAETVDPCGRYAPPRRQ
jgi:phosphatidylserine/phosphatidylglycerophosphate/cardiolipin synthase-like enzyme